MKKLILVGVIVLLMSSLGWAGELKRVDKLTDQEKQELLEAKNKLSEAQKNLEAVEYKISKSHNMSRESWMEWRSWYEIDGDYILSYFQSFMPNSISIILGK